ncbi:CLUMA_CG006093, isoform A [Clunio marinus]|uniref:CLUMA_CG006093, isoform A n=1 Tax=Clunio marinus TaxID=568069 RepID=A0A1J1I2C5_9DIPT|nr:CLUMA_CG006093, isoform A [Clunio marinus]
MLHLSAQQIEYLVVVMKYHEHFYKFYKDITFKLFSIGKAYLADALKMCEFNSLKKIFTLRTSGIGMSERVAVLNEEM